MVFLYLGRVSCKWVTSGYIKLSFSTLQFFRHGGGWGSQRRAGCTVEGGNPRSAEGAQAAGKSIHEQGTVADLWYAGMPSLGHRPGRIRVSMGPGRRSIWIRGQASCLGCGWWVYGGLEDRKWGCSTELPGLGGEESWMGSSTDVVLVTCTDRWQARLPCGQGVYSCCRLHPPLPSGDEH